MNILSLLPPFTAAAAATAASFNSYFVCVLRTIPNSSNCAAEIADGESIITSRAELFLGNAMKSRMDSLPPNREQSLSNPKAMPPCGGRAKFKGIHKEAELRAGFFIAKTENP
jgi:hypothetical protein